MLPHPPDVEIIHLAGWPDTPFLIPAWDKVIRPHVQSTGKWESELVAFAASHIGRRPRIAVAGGHIGLSAYQLWRLRPRAREISIFEPDSVGAGLLALNVRAWRGAPVRLWPFALGAEAALAELVSNPINSADNRLWRPGMELSASGGDPEMWRRQPTIIMPLDLVRGDCPLDLLFLDAQGWEPEILRGARATIARAKPLLVFEWWPRALAARGLDPYGELDWIERQLGARVFVTGDLQRDPRGARKATARLLDDADGAAHLELVGFPC